MKAIAILLRLAASAAAILGATSLIAGDDVTRDDHVSWPPAWRNTPWQLSDTTLADELVNPASPLLRIENTLSYRSYQGSLPGSDQGYAWVYEFTPVYPLAFANGRILELRATIPIVLSDYDWDVWYGDPIWELDRGYADWLLRQSPQVTPSTGRFRFAHGHLDDIRFDVAYGGIGDRGLIGMFGATLVVPNSTDISASRDQYLLGPQVVLGQRHDRGVYGARIRHLTNVYGDRRFDTNETSIEAFFTWQLGDGWQLLSRPSILCDWEADSGNRWLVPLGGGFSKTTRIGRVPLKLDAEAYYYAKTAERLGAEWQLSVRITPVLWNPWEN